MEKTGQPQETLATGVPSSMYVFLIMMCVFIFIGLGMLLGYLIWGNKNTQGTSLNNLPTSAAPSDIQSLFVSQSPAASDTATNNWTIYTDTNYSIKYPANWLLKKGFSTKDDLVMYDPKSVKDTTVNGAPAKLPTAYIDILSVTPSTQSAAQTVESYINMIKQKNIQMQSEESPVYKSNMVLFRTSGATSSTIVWSHNNVQAMLNATIKHLTDTSIENQILQTFQFAQQ